MVKMIDVHTKTQRSKNMAAIRGRYNKSTEIFLVKLFRTAKIRGWRRHSKGVPGTPDFIFPKKKVAVFTDGCFWHGCKRCFVTPKTNRLFWMKKIAANQKRDRRVNRQLILQGWRVIRLWEHYIKQTPERVLGKIF